MKVVCIINPKNKYALTVGEEYDVISFEKGKYKIKNNKGFIWSFNQWFFKPSAQIKAERRNMRLNQLLTN